MKDELLRFVSGETSGVPEEDPKNVLCKATAHGKS